VVLLLPWLLGPATPSLDARLRDIAAPSAFRLLDWETINLGTRAPRLVAGLVGDTTQPADAELLRLYFEDRSRRPELRNDAEAAMERAVSDAFVRVGVTRDQPLPLPSQHLFPPVLVALTTPPNVLVVAPRTELRVLESVVLNSLDVAAQERLEASADSTGVASLVAPIGGLATYPAMVLEEDQPERVLSSVAHEWLHQYLIFYPLGQAYWRSQQAREINETAADLVGQEVGHQVVTQLGLTTAGIPGPRGSQPRSDFDFGAFMRESRRQTEQLLAVGQVEQAEAYMRRRRDELQQHGYTIRKLNQAYFALYGSYGEGFAASPANPIPGLLRQARSKSPSLADFLTRIRVIQSLEDLRALAAG
jgi:hypothetical protein